MPQNQNLGIQDSTLIGRRWKLAGRSREPARMESEKVAGGNKVDLAVADAATAGSATLAESVAKPGTSRTSEGGGPQTPGSSSDTDEVVVSSQV